MPTFLSDNVTIAYIDHPPREPSSAPPVLLIHGFASNYFINWQQTLWIDFLTRNNRRVIALDNRGHGQSEKLHDPAQYAPPIMAQDSCNLLHHLGIPQADVMGYSMGGRLAAFLTLNHPDLVHRLIIGGLGEHLIHSENLPAHVAEAMEAPSLDYVIEPPARIFRAFAERTGSDLKAMAACIRASRQPFPEEGIARITCPVLVAVGTRDDVAGDGEMLARQFPNGRYLPIPGRDHQLAVGDRTYREGVLAFLNEV